MKTYVWLSFAFMGWGYYEMSGGGDFTPEQAPVLAAAEIEPIEDIVTRASTATLLSVSASNIETPEPVAVAVVEATPAVVTAPFTADGANVVENVAFTAAPPLDIRKVAGSRVNMRMGPSTDFEVITTLTGGTEMEVLEVTDDGWARVSMVERGIEGWMAERLLSPPQG